MNSTRATRLFAASLALFASATLAHAQSPCGVRTHFRIVTNMSGATGPGELRLDSGWSAAAPSLLPGTITTTNGGAMSCTGSCTATAFYGDLRCTASGTGTTIPGNGAFLWLDEWIGGQPKAQYQDSFTVTSSSLPAGTPVDIDFTCTLEGFAQVIDLNPTVSTRATLSVNQNGGPNVQASLTSFGSTTIRLHTAVGATGSIMGALHVDLFANGLLGGGPHTSSFACNVHSATITSIATAGAALITCSAAQYNGCGTADFNNDGDSGTDADIEAFFACLAGNCCPTCGTADFNSDGDTGTDADIESFFRVLAGGAC